MKIFIIILISLLLVNYNSSDENQVDVKISSNKFEYTTYDTIKCTVSFTNNTKKDIVILNLNEEFTTQIIKIKDKHGNKLKYDYNFEDGIIDPRNYYFKKDFVVLKKGSQRKFSYNIKIIKTDEILLVFNNTKFSINLNKIREIMISALYEINHMRGLKNWIDSKGQEIFSGYEFLEYAESSNSVTIKIND